MRSADALASTDAAASQPQTVHALVERQAALRPQALYARTPDGEQQTTFAGLADSCRQVVALLRALGTAPGDTVSLVMPNGLATLRLLLGAMHGGWCVNPVNLLSQPDQMRHVLAHSDCSVVLASPDWAEPVATLLAGLDRRVALLVVSADAEALPDAAEARWLGGPGIASAAWASPQAPAPSPDAIALLMYTSGTTGLPKGVMLSQANLAAAAHNISVEHSLTADDRVLAVLPLYHINAFAVTMLAPLAHGGSLVMPPRFSAGSFWPQALGSGCTWINLVPTMIAYLLEADAASTPPAAQLAHIRFARSASSALPPEHLRAFEARFGIGVVETMGLTETVAPSFSNPMNPAQRKLGAVGRASGCQAVVVDANLQPVADGLTGELVIHGPQVMRGYYKDSAATQGAFTPDGWLRTGDLGHRDGDGFFFVTGRIKELIIKGGENIAPREIDEALLRHPAVLEAAAVGAPDALYGQEILACVVLREGMACTDDDLRAFCTQHLGRYKTPKWFRFVASLPRGPSGKVQRLKLLSLGDGR